ncbi:MAG TPA: hypothetical protein VLS27_11005 [Gammaproteobacteria bacterium]|nr:hypothetical protein [Gammaproteobacteria bacterium]
MAVWTKQPQIIQPVVFVISDSVIQLEWNRIIQPFGQTTVRVLMVEDAFFEQFISKFVALYRRLVRKKFADRLSLARNRAATPTLAFDVRTI